MVSAGLTAAEAELVLNWKIGPAGKDFTDRYFSTAVAGPAERAKRSYSPVHLEAKALANDSLAVSWVRRGSVDGDGWDAAEIPLPEGMENYQLRVLGAGAVLKRSLTIAATGWTYPAAEMLSDFGTGASSVIIEVSQIGADGRPGIPAIINVSIEN